MAINLNWFSLRVLTTPRFLVALFIVVMCIQFVPIEGMGVSPVKVAVMALTPFIFIAKTPQINKAVIWGGALWLSCFFCAYFAGPIRWSTLGYFGMFIMTFICFYSLMRTGEVSIEWFANLLKSLIILFGTVLILQQVSVLIGLRNNPFLNLYPPLQHYISITKLPILTQEPSSSARMLALFMLGYLECYKFMNGGVKAAFSDLFDRDNRLMSILFLWAMLTMGSGTAFIALGMLCIYFITLRSSIYIIPAIVITIALGNYMQIKQFNRAKSAIETTAKLDPNAILEEDTSAAVRIIPLINLFTKTELSDTKTWFGIGTTENPNIVRDRTKDQIGIIVQYGMISFILSLILVYTCCIYKVFSIETLMYLFLFGFSIGNVAYGWGAIMVLAGIRYFNESYARNPATFDEESHMQTIESIE